MYSALTMIRKYLRYYFSAGNAKGHGMHSPFVFDFITKVLNDRTVHPEYTTVEQLRKKLQQDQRTIEVQDFGAGSSHGTGNTRRVKDIARHAAKPPKYGQLLYRIARYYRFDDVLEMGTSLGITTSYLAMANPAAGVTSLEGSPAIAEIATDNFSTLRIKNVEVVVGNFDDTFPGLITEGLRPKLIFIDGNHRYEPTMRYFNDLLKIAESDTMLIFDDIHWSAEMEQAWKEIRNHASVACTIDLFFIGIVLFRKEFREQQHFAVKF